LRKPNKIRLFEIILCSCGCGKNLNKFDERNRTRKSFPNHLISLKGEKQGRFIKNRKPWNLGLTTNNNLSLKQVGEKSRERLLKNPLRYWLGKKRPDVAKRNSIIMTGRKLTKEHIKNSLKRRKMSGLEEKVLRAIKKYNLPYKFVGNGKFFIERINPDFVNTNGRKLAVEVYWKRHKDQFRDGGEKYWKEKRLQILNKYGWDIIFIEGTNLTENIILKSLKEGGTKLQPTLV